MTNGQAQNKLGQLFVDIGVGGLGQTLKALNSVSATFLLTKNAATQAIKPFVDMGVQAANSAVGIGKMASALATTKLNAQKLRYFLKEKGAEGLESDIAKIQKMYADYKQRIGGPNMQFAYALERLGLHWKNYSGSFEDTLKLVQDVKNSDKFKKLSDIEQLSVLNQLGLNGEWKYLFEKADFDINKALSVTEDEIQKEIDLAESMKKLGNSIDQIKQKLVSIAIEGGLLTKLDRIATKLDNIMGGAAENNSISFHAESKLFGWRYDKTLLGGGAENINSMGTKDILPFSNMSNFIPSSMNNYNLPPTGALQPQSKVVINQTIQNKGKEDIQAQTKWDLMESINNDPSLNAIEINNMTNNYSGSGLNK